MSHAPKIPREQRSFADKGARPPAEPTTEDRRDHETETRTGEPADADVNADVNLDQRGRFGNLNQNLTAHWKVQQR